MVFGDNIFIMNVWKEFVFYVKYKVKIICSFNVIVNVVFFVVVVCGVGWLKFCVLS